jgi:transmembrane sensor
VVCAWIEDDPRHAIAFARAEAAWDATERLKCSAADVALPPISEFISEEAQLRLSRNIMIAAGIAVLLFIIAAIVTVRTFNGIDRYETAVGQSRRIILADGSTLHLNSDSEAEVRFTDHGRKVRLMRGEASFDVTPDPHRTFDVETRAAVIRATGTAFNVRMRHAMVELTVTHGNLSVQSGSQTAQRVRAGTGAIIRPRTIALTTLGPRLMEQRTAWRARQIDLEGQTVEQATEEFNRYRTAPILIGDTRVSGLRMSGRFTVSGSTAFLAALQQRQPIRVVYGEDGSVMLLYREAAKGELNPILGQ